MTTHGAVMEGCVQQAGKDPNAVLKARRLNLKCRIIAGKNLLIN